ncbi:MAG: hypothetical protein N4A44_00945 [Alphaproteobacteria bacterium]|jgi:hypothetical protein|nr:hypothetical protein [Alphaproteobacteria bacterium]
MFNRGFQTFLVGLFLGISGTSYSAYFDVTSMPDLKKKEDARNMTRHTRDLSNDCNKFIGACIDQICADKEQVKRRETSGGLYDKCGRMSLNKLVGKISDCMERFNTDEFNYQLRCRAGIVGQVEQFLTNKDELEKNFKSSSIECVESKRDMMAARNCYSVMIKSDGGVDVPMQEALYQNCGPVSMNGSAVVAADFFTTGLVGRSNAGELMANDMKPYREENWRELVEVKLAGYIEKAQSSCGDEDFEISQINLYKPDEKSVELQKQEAAAWQMGVDAANGTDAQECRDRNIYQPLDDAIWKYDPAQGCLKIKVD